MKRRITDKLQEAFGDNKEKTCFKCSLPTGGNFRFAYTLFSFFLNQFNFWTGIAGIHISSLEVYITSFYRGKFKNT